MASKEDVHTDVRLVVADVDGTLVTPDKILTPRALAAVRTVLDAGIRFTITSGRPPLGMKLLIDELQLVDPITAFNGGLVVRAANIYVLVAGSKKAGALEHVLSGIPTRTPIPPRASVQVRRR